MSKSKFITSSIFTLTLVLNGCGQPEPPAAIEEPTNPAQTIATTQSGPSGTWDIRWESISFINNAPTEVFGYLKLEPSGDGVKATFRDEPISVEIDGNQIVFNYDEALRSEGGGRRGQVSLTFTGQINGDEIHGELSRIDGVIHEDAVGQVSSMAKYSKDAAPGYLPETLSMQRFLPVELNISNQWSATRVNPQNTNPSINGVWIPRPELSNDWLRNVNAAMTEDGVKRREQWHPYDDPALRCGSSGLVRISGNPLPIVITSSDWEVSLLFEDEHAIQHVYTDGRAMYDAWIPSGLGYSVGHWDMSTLVIQTKWLLGNWIGGRGLEHQGEQTVVTERYTMTGDGKYLLSEMVLEDPLTFTRTLKRVRGYERDIQATIYPYECDSYTFFKGLYEDGKTDSYFIREMKY
jgi:hypothetical protein